MTDLLVVEALWVLGYKQSDQLPEVAVQALRAGQDSNLLRRLAGLGPGEIHEANELFLQVLKELGLAVLSKSEAARICATDISSQILNGQLSPSEGANRIWDASSRVGDSAFHDLDPFVYAASELQSRPEDKDFFEEEIQKEARAWASRAAG